MIKNPSKKFNRPYCVAYNQDSPSHFGADEINGKYYKEIGKLLLDIGFSYIKIKEVDNIDPDRAATDPYSEITVLGLLFL